MFAECKNIPHTRAMASTSPERRRLTDADLVDTEFRFTDPENSIPGLNRAVPDSEANPVIVGYYDETPAGGRKANPDTPFVWCCHCGKRTHWKGRVVRDDRGEVYIIGASTCGREHYGDRFEAAERSFRAERDRRRALIRWKEAVPLAREYRAELEEVLGWPGLSMLERKKDEIARASVVGLRKLRRYIGTATEMVAHYDVRDLAAEEERERKYKLAMAALNYLSPQERRSRREEGLIPEHDVSQIWRRTSTPLGFVTGGDFLLDTCDARTRAIELRATIDAMLEIEAQGTDGVDGSRLTSLLQQLAGGSAALRDAMHALAFVDLFFSHENLDRLAKWSEHEAQFGYEREGAALVVVDTSRGRTVIQPPDLGEWPACQALQASRHLDENFADPALDG